MKKQDARFVLEEFQKAGIENILALRGDKIEGREPADDFLYASDLISFIREFNEKRTDGKKFKILGACYPECLPESVIKAVGSAEEAVLAYNKEIIRRVASGIWIKQPADVNAAKRATRIARLPSEFVLFIIVNSFVHFRVTIMNSLVKA